MLDLSNIVSGFFGALIGAFITGFFALRAVYLAQRLKRKDLLLKELRQLLMGLQTPSDKDEHIWTLGSKKLGSTYYMNLWQITESYLSSLPCLEYGRVAKIRDELFGKELRDRLKPVFKKGIRDESESIDIIKRFVEAVENTTQRNQLF